MGDYGESLEGAVVEGAVDQVSVVVADKGCKVKKHVPLSVRH